MEAMPSELGHQECEGASQMERLGEKCVTDRHREVPKNRAG